VDGGYINRLSPSSFLFHTIYHIFIYSKVQLYSSCLLFSALKHKAYLAMFKNQNIANTCLAYIYLLKDIAICFMSGCGVSLLKYLDNPLHVLQIYVRDARCPAVASLCSKILEYTQYHPNHGSLKSPKDTDDVFFFLCPSKKDFENRMLQKIVCIDTCLRTVSLFCSYITLHSSRILVYIKMVPIRLHVSLSSKSNPEGCIF
jgi:hypothetical protein